MTRHIIVRHGDTFGPRDVVTRVGARTDLPLVESGLRQAHALAEEAVRQGWRLARAACSPLRRTQQTARAILESVPQAPVLEILPFLTEIDYGPDENQPEEAVRARLGSALDEWESEAIPPPGWQVDPHVLGQAWRDHFAQAPNGSDSLIVTSNGVARFALWGFTGQALPKLKTGAYGVLEGDVQTGVSIARWNIRPS